MNQRDNPFLTVVRHPPGWHSDQVATLLNDAAGMDLPSLRLKLRQKPPMIVWQVDHQTADLAIRALQKNGGDGLAVTLSSMEQLGPTVRIRDLRVDGDQIRIEPWRQDTATIAADQIEFLVRAQLSKRTSETLPTYTAAGNRYRNAGMTAFTLGGVPGLAAAHAAGLTGAHDRPIRNVSTSDKLDIHLADGRIYQIDGDRFSYKALGDMKGHADKINMDRMRDLLAHLAPAANVDNYFSLWRAPAGHHRLRLPRGGANDDPSFAFYSRWSAIVYRHVGGSET